MNKIYFSVLCTLLSFSVWAQESQILTMTKNYLTAESSNLNLKTSDLNDLTVQTNYTDQKTNIEYAYVQQNPVVIRFTMRLRILQSRTARSSI